MAARTLCDRVCDSCWFISVGKSVKATMISSSKCNKAHLKQQSRFNCERRTELTIHLFLGEARFKRRLVETKHVARHIHILRHALDVIRAVLAGH